MRRTLDQTGNPIERHGHQSICFGEMGKLTRFQQAFQHVGAARGDHHDRKVACWIKCRRKEVQESRALHRRRDGEHLLELIDRQQHGCPASVAHSKILEQLLDVVDCSGAAEHGVPDPPIIGLADLLRNRLGKRFYRRFFRPDIRQHHPFAPPPGKLRQYAGLEQRGFSGA